MFMLDTNIISDLVRNPNGRAAERLAGVGDGDIVTSVIIAGASLGLLFGLGS